MNTPLCTRLNIDFPLFAFSHCRDVVVAVSKAGGFGVFGAAGFAPDELETELRWIDSHIDGRPYGVDLLIPENLAIRTAPGATARDVAAQIPEQHRQFVSDLLRRFDVDPTRPIGGTSSDAPVPFQRDTGERLMEVAFRHPIRLIANALGVPPASMLQRARAHGIPCAALVGAKQHAVRQVQAGVDIIVAQGTEAGGHCGEVSTMVLVPEVVARAAHHGQRHSGAGGGRHHDRTADGGRHGDGRGRRLDRLGLARHHGSGDLRNVPREDGGGAVARYGAVALPHRKAGAPVALGLDRGVGRAGQSWPAADAAAKPSGRPGDAADRRMRSPPATTRRARWSTTMSARASGWWRTCVPAARWWHRS